MALKPCLNCGHLISEVAAKCPKCDHRTSELDKVFLKSSSNQQMKQIEQTIVQQIQVEPPKEARPRELTNNETLSAKSLGGLLMVNGYDPQIINTVASDLYKQAEMLIISTMITYALVWAFVGFMVAGSISPFFEHVKILISIGFGAIGAFQGNIVAQPKALLLRYQAQMALCTLQIEFNTRPNQN